MTEECFNDNAARCDCSSLDGDDGCNCGVIGNGKGFRTAREASQLPTPRYRLEW